MNDYSVTIVVEASRAHVFRAISTELSLWWGAQDNLIDQNKMIFRVSWGEPWYEFELLEYRQDQEMVWECIDANQKIKGLKNIEKEWVGTKIHWKLVALTQDRTELEFRHEGLVPELICFEFCSASWGHFLKEALVNYIAKEKDNIY